MKQTKDDSMKTLGYIAIILNTLCFFYSFFVGDDFYYVLFSINGVLLGVCILR